MSTKIYWVNHSSVLIAYRNNYILTDPFYNSPAFETWLPSPPSFYNPAYLLALSKSNDFAIIISHGHDDHLDDKLLKLFVHSTIFITKFSSPGLYNRLKKIGFKNIIELGSTGFNFKHFELSSYINKKYSYDDSIQIINTPDVTFVHANDCWWPLEEKQIKQIKKNKRKKIIYASQIAVADGYPAAYDCFTKREKIKIYNQRVTKSLKSGMKNASKLKSNLFLPYAGHIKMFTKNEDVNTLSGFIEKDFIENKLKYFPNKDKVKFSEWKTGDVFQNGKIVNVFENKFLSEKNIKNASDEYWNQYANLNYKKFRYNNTNTETKKLLNNFVNEFTKYVINSTPKKKFREEILFSKIIFEVINIKKKIIKFAKYNDKNRLDLHIKWDSQIANLILKGKINFEASYIGCLGKFNVKPKNHYNGHVVRWLTMFGYVWQKKLYKKYLKK